MSSTLFFKNSITSEQTGTFVGHLGHTSFIINRGDTSILIDPILIRPNLEFRRPVVPQWLSNDLSSFKSLFISHGHNDHLHPPSLLGLPKDMSIYFLSEENGKDDEENPNISLRDLGFSKLNPFKSGESVSLPDEIKVHIIPAENSTEGEEQCCFLIESPDVLVLDAVDIKDSSFTRKSLEKYRGKIEIAFIPAGAAVQWQGFWNQMDTLEALEFCNWLQPKKVAVSGGVLSLSDRPQPDTLERYPKDMADWLMTAASNIATDRMLLQRPPFILRYYEHDLRRINPIKSQYTGYGGNVNPVQALIATFFTGYHPKFPTKRFVWPDETLKSWLDTLQVIKDVISNSQRDIEYLLKRCSLSINKTPSAILAPTTLRWLIQHNEIGVATQIVIHVPSFYDDYIDFELGYFEYLESIIRNNVGQNSDLLSELITCLWIDRNMFNLWNIYLKLKDLISFPESRAHELTLQHIADLEKTIDKRRPILGPNNLRLNRYQAQLIGSSLKDNVEGMICFASPEGIHHLSLNNIENLFLDSLDGRTFKDIAESISHIMNLSIYEVRKALFFFISKLARKSVLVIDWSS